MNDGELLAIEAMWEPLQDLQIICDNGQGDQVHHNFLSASFDGDTELDADPSLATEDLAAALTMAPGVILRLLAEVRRLRSGGR